jgi:hypothetical protein
MTSDVFIRFIEDGLQAHGVTKVMPDVDLLEQAYAAFRREEIVRERVAKTIANLQETPVETPADLRERLSASLDANPSLPWDDALRAIADGMEAA